MMLSAARRERGVIAVMFAVLIVALCTLYAVNLAWDSTLDARRSASLYWREQSIQVGLGAEDWIREILKEDRTSGDTDHLGEIWAQELPPLPVDGAGLVGEVAGSLEDLQGRFNLNNLVDPQGNVDTVALEQFQRLLQALEIEVSYAGIVVDWLDRDSDPTFPDGAEDNTYTALVPPFRTANQRLSSASELAAVDGMTPEIYTQLLPHVTALPGVTLLNVNTATPAVLRSLDDRIEGAQLEQLLEERAEGGFLDYGQTFSALIEPDMLPRIGESTEFFRLHAIVRIGTVRISMYSLLQRSAQGQVATVLRTFGTD